MTDQANSPDLIAACRLADRLQMGEWAVKHLGAKLIRELVAEIERLRRDVHNLNWALGAPGYDQMATPEEQAESDAAVARTGQIIERIAANMASRDKLRTFLNAAAGEGFVLAGVDAADLYIALFPAEYEAACAQIDPGVTG